MATTYHAEHVGSLLRPPYLLRARQAHETGELTTAQLHEVEDRAIAELLDIQKQAGLTVFTDGEARRESWRAGLLESLGAEATFMAARAPGTFKITMISASMGGMIWDRERSSAVYPAPNDLIEDLAALQIDEIGGLAARGVRWVQLDSLSYNQVIDPGATGRTRAALTPEQALDAAITVDSKIVTAVKREHQDLTVGMHICRGNYRSSWMAQGGYEPVAERLFNEVPVDRFLLEYDTERAGGFEPLRFVPPGPTVVLGLVTTKVPQLETRDDLLRRIDEAARYAPLEQLALSPQCGFASGSLGNLITVDDERRKLDLVVSVAGQVWG